MTIELAPDQEDIINRSIAAGHYNSFREVVDAALRLLEEDEIVREVRLARLRADIDVADERAAEGRLRSYSAADMLERIRAHAQPVAPRR